MCEANITSSAGINENYGMTVETDDWVYTQGIFGDDKNGTDWPGNLERISMVAVKNYHKWEIKEIPDSVQIIKIITSDAKNIL